jgi:micrococcal nuclease
MKALALAVAALAGFIATGTPAANTTSVERIIDGDTLVVRGGDRVRLVGIDTPERGECGFNAATFQLSLLARGKIALERPTPMYDDRDYYGRLLRYIRDRHVDVGYVLVLRGYAEAYRPYPHPRYVRYLRAEMLAQSEQRGLWNPKGCGRP